MLLRMGKGPTIQRVGPPGWECAPGTRLRRAIGPPSGCTEELVVAPLPALPVPGGMFG